MSKFEDIKAFKLVERYVNLIKPDFKLFFVIFSQMRDAITLKLSKKAPKMSQNLNF